MYQLFWNIDVGETSRLREGEVGGFRDGTVQVGMLKENYVGNEQDGSSLQPVAMYSWRPNAESPSYAPLARVPCVRKG
jgi:hypothetical protein